MASGGRVAGSTSHSVLLGTQGGSTGPLCAPGQPSSGRGVSPPGTRWEALELPLTRSVWPGGSWSTLASDIFDCCYLASKLSRGGVYAFRTACVSKAGMGPYSSPSEQVHLGGPRHLGEPLQDLVGVGWRSLWNCPAPSPKYTVTGEVCSGQYAAPPPSPNGPKNERPGVGLKGAREGVRGDKVGELGLGRVTGFSSHSL